MPLISYPWRSLKIAATVPHRRHTGIQRFRAHLLAIASAVAATNVASPAMGQDVIRGVEVSMPLGRLPEDCASTGTYCPTVDQCDAHCRRGECSTRTSCDPFIVWKRDPTDGGSDTFLDHVASFGYVTRVQFPADEFYDRQFEIARLSGVVLNTQHSTHLAIRGSIAIVGLPPKYSLFWCCDQEFDMPTLTLVLQAKRDDAWIDLARWEGVVVPRVGQVPNGTRLELTGTLAPTDQDVRFQVFGTTSNPGIPARLYVSSVRIFGAECYPANPNDPADTTCL